MKRVEIRKSEVTSEPQEYYQTVDLFAAPVEETPAEGAPTETAAEGATPAEPASEAPMPAGGVSEEEQL